MWCMAWSNSCKWSDSWLINSTTLTAFSLVPSSPPQIQVWKTHTHTCSENRHEKNAMFTSNVSIHMCSDGVGHLQWAARRRRSIRSAVWRKRHEWCSGHCAFLVSYISVHAFFKLPASDSCLHNSFLLLILKFSTQVWPKSKQHSASLWWWNITIHLLLHVKGVFYCVLVDL